MNRKRARDDTSHTQYTNGDAESPNSRWLAADPDTGSKLLTELERIRGKNRRDADQRMPRKRTNTSHDPKMGDCDDFFSRIVAKELTLITDDASDDVSDTGYHDNTMRALQLHQRAKKELPGTRQLRLMEIFGVSPITCSESDAGKEEPGALSKKALEEPFSEAPRNPFALLCAPDAVALMKLNAYTSLDVSTATMRSSHPRVIRIDIDSNAPQHTDRPDTQDTRGLDAKENEDDEDEDSELPSIASEVEEPTTAPCISIARARALLSVAPLCAGRTAPGIMRELERDFDLTLHRVHLGGEDQTPPWLLSRVQEAYSWSRFPWRAHPVVLDFVLGGQNVFLVRFVYASLCPRENEDFVPGISSKAGDIQTLLKSARRLQTRDAGTAAVTEQHVPDTATFMRDAFKHTCGEDSTVWQRVLLVYATHYFVTSMTREERARNSHIYIE